MKTNHYIQLFRWMIFGCILWTTSSCQRDYLAFDLTMKPGIYIAHSIGEDTNKMTLNQTGGDSTIYEFVIQVLGEPVDYDRDYLLIAVEDTSALSAKKDIHYNLPDDMTIKAGKISDKCRITYWRYRDPEWVDTVRILKVALQENENFRSVIKQDLCFKVKSVQSKKPGWWSKKGQLLQLGPFSDRLYNEFMSAYWALEETRPYTYKLIFDKHGKDLKKNLEWGALAYEQEKLLNRYVTFPLYEYYQEHPTEGIEIPEPKYDY